MSELRGEGEANTMHKSFGCKAAMVSKSSSGEAFFVSKPSAEAFVKSSISEATHCDDVSAVGY